MQTSGRLIAILTALGLFAGAIFAAAGPAAAETRVALVIGNGAYQRAPKLPNPRNDAEDVSAALKRIGFDTIVGLDLDKAAMEDAIIRFARAARSADVALFYYSGHAMQHAGVNYLMPVDVKLTDEADLRRMSKVDEIVADLQQAKNLRILVLDACRDNPLAEDLKRNIGPTRAAAVSRGLAKIDSPQGMVVAYATQAGKTADDGQGRNSPFTTAFLKHIETAEEIGTVFRRITADVYAATKSTQFPELSLSLVRDYYLLGRPAAPATTGSVAAAAPAALPPVATAGAPAVGPAAADPCADAAAHWRSAEAIGTEAVLEDHLARFSNCAFAGLARAKLEEQKAAQDRPTPPMPISPAAAPEPEGGWPAPAERPRPGLVGRVLGFVFGDPLPPPPVRFQR